MLNSRRKPLYPFAIVGPLLIIVALTLAGCGQFSAFKELNVNDKNIPDYHETGKAVLGEPGVGDFSGLWATLEAEADELIEDDARKIAADYITDNTKYSLVSVRIKSYGETFLAEYYKDASAVEKAGLDKKFDKWPGLTFEEIPKDN